MTTIRTSLSRFACAAALLVLASGTAHAGRYTKIANNGALLPASAVLGSGPTDWACTYDSTAGLLWEVKTADGGLRDKNKTYSNYDSGYGTQSQIDAATNSIGFATAVNAASLCGYTDWRLPSADELLGLVNTAYSPTIDSTYFPNTLASILWFWSGSPHAGYSSYARLVSFGVGLDSWDYRSSAGQVRLVRAVQLIGHLVSLTGRGAGRVVADGIDCVRMAGANYGTCATRVWPGSIVTLTATPADGSTFTGWGGDCSGSGATCTLTMDAAKSVTADFQASISTRAIVIDPAAPTTLHAAVDGQGIYNSANSGGTWTAATTQPANTNLRALAIKPGDSSKLFAATYGGGMFKSIDSGATWSACAGQPGNLNLVSLAIDAAGKLYAGSDGGVFASADACATWTAINSGLPN